MTKLTDKLTFERLREVLDYDPLTGVFSWRVRLSNRGVVGTRAGTPLKGGYVAIRIDGVRYLAHRLAWLYTHGSWPPALIDHKDRDPSNNRLANLRPATRLENHQNLNPRRANTSGFTGVSRCPVNPSKWRAGITYAQRQHYLGRFDTPEEAHAAYLAAKAKLHRFHPHD